MIKVVFNIIKSFFGLIFKIFSPFKRLICRRRKKLDEDIIVPVNDQHSTAIDMTQSFPENEVELQAWDSWGMDDQSQPQPYQNQSQQYTQKYSHKTLTQQYAQGYRQKKQSESEPEPEPDVDFFQNMEPEFKKAAKIKLKKKEDTYINKAAISSRLAVTSDVPLPGSELESWEEVNSAWGDEVVEDLSWEADAAIKEKRRAERQERKQQQQRKRQEKDSRGMKRDGHIAAVKLS